MERGLREVDGCLWNLFVVGGCYGGGTSGRVNAPETSQNCNASPSPPLLEGTRKDSRLNMGSKIQYRWKVIARGQTDE